jgi:hypothetical protein
MCLHEDSACREANYYLPNIKIAPFGNFIDGYEIDSKSTQMHAPKNDQIQ